MFDVLIEFFFQHFYFQLYFQSNKCYCRSTYIRSSDIYIYLDLEIILAFTKEFNFCV